MSNTGPFGHQPTSLSLGMGLSDPRLRRALQLDGVSEQKIGFGLKIDSQGRLSVDSAGLAGDQTTITNIVQSFANFSSSTSTTVGGGGGGFDDSLFDDWLSNTLLYAEVQKLIEATGVNDPQFGWFFGGSDLYQTSNILRYLGTRAQVDTVWSETIELDHEFKGDNVGSVIVHIPISGYLRRNVEAHININVYDEQLSGTEEMAAGGWADLMTTPATSFAQPYQSIPLNNWGHDTIFDSGATPQKLWFFGFGETGSGDSGDADPDSGEKVFVSTDHATWQQYYMERPHAEAGGLTDNKSYVRYPYANGTTWVYRKVPLIDDLPENCANIKFRFYGTAFGSDHESSDFFKARIKIRVSHELHNDPFTM